MSLTASIRQKFFVDRVINVNKKCCVDAGLGLGLNFTPLSVLKKSIKKINFFLIFLFVIFYIHFYSHKLRVQKQEIKQTKGKKTHNTIQYNTIQNL